MSHSNTVLSHILNLIVRHDFQKLENGQFKPHKSKGLTSDQTIILTGPKAGHCPIPLRRVDYKDSETGKHYFFLTNNFHLAAKTIADIYKDR